MRCHLESSSTFTLTSADTNCGVAGDPDLPATFTHVVEGTYPSRKAYVRPLSPTDHLMQGGDDDSHDDGKEREPGWE